MNLLFQVIINSIILGSIYSLLSLGFHIISSANRFIYLAAGSAAVSSSYLFFALSRYTNIALAAVLSIAISMILGMMIWRLFFSRRIKKEAMLLISFALSIIIENLLILFFGPGTVNDKFEVRSYNIMGAFITGNQILIILFSLLCLLILYMVYHKTKTGLFLRAVSVNTKLAEYKGIDTKKAELISFAAGYFVLCISGILLAMERNILAARSMEYTFKGFTGSAIGGFSGVLSAFAGGMLLGLIENLSALLFPSGYTNIVTYSSLFILLAARYRSGIYD